MIRRTDHGREIAETIQVESLCEPLTPADVYHILDNIASNLYDAFGDDPNKLLDMVTKMANDLFNEYPDIQT